jgi:hypothetical protein
LTVVKVKPVTGARRPRRGNLTPVFQGSMVGPFKYEFNPVYETLVEAVHDHLPRCFA